MTDSAWFAILMGVVSLVNIAWAVAARGTKAKLELHVLYRLDQAEKKLKRLARIEKKLKRLNVIEYRLDQLEEEVR